jgi:hypothetical protein
MGTLHQQVHVDMASLQRLQNGEASWELVGTQAQTHRLPWVHSTQLASGWASLGCLIASKAVNIVSKQANHDSPLSGCSVAAPPPPAHPRSTPPR